MIKTIKKEKYFLLTIFFISFLIRGLVFYFYLSKDKNYWQVDSNTYHKIAESIVQGKGISIGEKPQFYRLPGYSIFLSIYYNIFGTDTKNVLWMQIFLASFIPILIFFLSLVFFPYNFLLAKVSSLYSCFHLGLVLYSSFFMTESLFIFFLLLFSFLFFSSFHLFFCKIQNKHQFFILKKLFFAGIFLGAASLVRPVGHYIVVLSILLLLFSKGILKNKLKKAFVFIIGWLLVVIWWLLRNFLITGCVFFHTLPGGHFLYLSAARVAMYPQNCSYWQARRNLSKEVESRRIKKEKLLKRKLNEIELCYIRENVAIKYFKQYPFLSIKNWITDILRTSFSLYSAELVLLDHNREGINYFKKGRTVLDMFKRYLPPKVSSNFLFIVIFFEILTFLFVFIGFVLGFIKNIVNFCKFKLKMKPKLKSMFCVWLRIVPLIFLFIIVGLSGGFNRMRLPVEPFLIILSFSFWIWILKKKILKVINGV